MTELLDHYDVVIIGGAVMGSSTAYWLTESPDFDGTILVIEPDPTYEKSSTTLSAASIRHQFSNPVNIALSQFGTEFVKDFAARVEVDGDAPALGFRETGYMFCATDAGLPALRRNVEIQQSCGADIQLHTPAEVADRFPYLNVDDLAGCSFGNTGEGTLDAYSLLMGFRQRARHNGAVYCTDRAVGLAIDEERITTVELASGRKVDCNEVVNAAGPRAQGIARLAGLQLPVEPRKRTIFVFDCRTPIEARFPLTIDITGVHFRTDPPHYVAGGVPRPDTEVDDDDFAVARDEWEDQVWPALANRVPLFEEVGLKRAWAGHYAYNTLDQNAVIGRAAEVPNFIFANGFSGHGLQQSAGVGRGVSELIIHGRYRTLDLTPLGPDRSGRNEPFLESAII